MGICDRIREKGTFHAVAEFFLFLIVHNFKAVIATYRLKTRYGDSPIIALHSLKILCLYNSGMDMVVASIAHDRKSAIFMSHFWSSTTSGANIATHSNVGFL